MCIPHLGPVVPGPRVRAHATYSPDMHVNNQGNEPLRGGIMIKRTVFPAVRVAFRAVDPLWSVFRENDGVGAEEQKTLPHAS